MAYLGNTPTTQSFISGTDYFNGDGSTTAFTLTRTVESVNDIEAVVNNVVQRPNDAYTISGTTITFTSAPSSGTDNIYVRYLSTTTQSITPSQGTVSTASLGNITNIASGNSSLTLQTGSSPTTAVTIDTSQTVNIAKAIQLSTGESGLYATDAALSNYASDNGVYLNGNSAGWLRLSNDGTNSTRINLNGSSYSTANQIEMFTAGTERMRIKSDGGIFSQPTGGGGLLEQFGCRAWVNFNGEGTPSIRGSGNVSSITDDGTGQFRINFSTALPDLNYVVCVGASNGTDYNNYQLAAPIGHSSTSSAKVWTGWTNGNYDHSWIQVAVFR
jgi:hypothetical protein